LRLNSWYYYIRP